MKPKSPNPQSQFRASKKKHPTMADLTKEKGPTGMQRAIEQHLQLHGWTWWHVPDSWYKPGEGKERIKRGLPDIIALGPRNAATPVLLWLELKAEGRNMTAEQRESMAIVQAMDCDHILAGVVRPSNYNEWLAIIAQIGKQLALPCR